jgi:enoyl-[acyl-carrier-protein] reductase (NADH)
MKFSGDLMSKIQQIVADVTRYPISTLSSGADLEGGAIITMSTVASHRYLQGFGSQGVVKAAVESLTQYLACELAAFNIRTNCISEGSVYGELLDSSPDSQSIISHWKQITLGKRLCHAEDIAAVVETLLLPQMAHVNGGIGVIDNAISKQIDGRLPMVKSNFFGKKSIVASSSHKEQS